jgi:hypothetical protein
VPWRGPDEPGSFPTLGYQVADWIAANCAIPDGDRQGDPFELTDEQLLFVLWFYRVDPTTGRLFYRRGGQLVRPQKWGKGPLSAAIICAEAEGPVLPDGWDAKGDPVGRPWSTPLIQVTAISEDQAANVYRALVPMIELGSMAADVPDTGETRINLRGGGRIEPVTASARSRLGARITFANQDQTESWLKSNGGRALADNQRRNLAGMGGRWLETPNAWDPTEQSVAQQTAESNAPGVYRDDVDPGPGSVHNKADRRRMLRKVYGGSWWVDRDRIDAEIVDLLPRDPAQAERWFLNRKRAEAGAAFDLGRWREATNRCYQPEAGATITIGVDGARHDDALAIVATEVVTGHQWPLGIWEQPVVATADYEHPLEVVDGVMIEAFERFVVWRAYVDPQYIEGLRDRWQGRWGDKRVLNWYMNRYRQAAFAAQRYAAAIANGEVPNDGDEVMDRHVANARRYKVAVYDVDRRQMWVLSKDRPMSPNKIDGAAAGCLSWEARGDAIADGVLERAVTVTPAEFASF